MNYRGIKKEEKYEVKVSCFFLIYCLYTSENFEEMLSKFIDGENYIFVTKERNPPPHTCFIINYFLFITTVTNLFSYIKLA